MLRKSAAVVTVATLTAGLLVGCSTGGPQSGEGQQSEEAPTVYDTGFNPNADVTLEFWAWDPGMDLLVRTWNENNPDVQVNLVNPAGGDELVAKMITAHKAGNGPDIGKIEYQALPSMVSSGVVSDMSEYVSEIRGQFDDNVWSLVTFDGATYGVPQDFAPLMMFYQPEVFEAAGVGVPTTWEEFATAAEAIHANDTDTYIATFSSGDPGWFAGLTQQRGANWWSAKDNKWTVAINGTPSMEVAEYWREQIDTGNVKGDPFWSPQWNKEMNDGTYATWISGAWAAAQIRGIAPDLAGKWMIAPLPAWDEGDASTGIWGGSAMSVMADSKHPEEAAAFINWLNASDEGLSQQIKDIGIYPAANNGRALPELSDPPEFFSNQSNYYEVIATAAKSARSFEIWGPNANVTFSSYRDEFAKAIQNNTSFTDALDAMQNATVTDMSKLGFELTK